MLIGAHCVISSPKPEADLAFFRDVLKLPSIDDGGYVIFGLPPPESPCTNRRAPATRSFSCATTSTPSSPRCRSARSSAGRCRIRAGACSRKSRCPAAASSTFTGRGTSVQKTGVIAAAPGSRASATSPTTTKRGHSCSRLRAGRESGSYGSATMVRSLLAADLVDELLLTIEPITLGGGKRSSPKTERRSWLPICTAR
jgi:hypothetical protein